MLLSLKPVRARRRKAYIPEFMYHVTLWVPVLILSISENLDELLQNGSLAAVASLSELSGIVIVAVDLSFMFVVAILSPKNGWADRTGEVLDMVLALKRRDIRTAQCATTLETEEVETPEVVSLAQWVLALAIFIIDGEEF
jgi:hypothetical protein